MSSVGGAEMRGRSLSVSAFVACVLIVGSVGAQVGHPAKGSWLGYWGPNPREQHRMFLLLDWENREIVGTINPGPDAVPLDRAEIDYATWTLTIEAQMPLESGGTAPYIATGKLENLGSWVNRRYSGTYRHGAETGTFLLTLN
ncbi:MAG TPA: hypothetical protein VIC71_15270 [Gammaproteobacteria bacterium]